MDRAFQRIRSLMLRDTFYSVPPNMTGEQICGMLHISNRTLQKLRDERGIAYTVIGGKFLYPLSKLQLLLEENYRNYIR